MFIFILCNSWIVEISISEVVLNGCSFFIFTQARYHKFVIFCLVWVGFKNIQEYIKQLILWEIRIRRLCEKISVNSTTVIKNDIVGRLEKQPLNFFTVYNKYRNLSSFFNS